QIQLNYLDFEDASVQSRLCLEICRKHGKPVIVMEPVKGGALADPPQKVKDLFKAYAPDASCASWAVRYAASLDGIITVLSGMSTPEQVEDNISYMKDFRPLNEEEQKIIEQAREIIEKEVTIPCTACHYCTDGCPMQIPIPEIFRISNDNILSRRAPGARKAYAKATEGRGKASDCVSCGQCEGACPQQLPIISLLEECREMEG
ncbi:MAG: aldo/keto reductase, partial [Firmicutes bacterium]|nr:aldo/keto reductase [Bacillota bacterium]